MEDGNIDGAVPVSSILTLNKNATAGPLLIQAALQATSLFTLDSFFANKDCSLHPSPPMLSFYTTWNHQINRGLQRGFLFSGAYKENINSPGLIHPHLQDSRHYLLKLNNRKTTIRCEICSKSTMKTSERCLASF